METVLGVGYLRLIETMGSDLEVVNDARASFMKGAEWDVEWPAPDEDSYQLSLDSRNVRDLTPDQMRLLLEKCCQDGVLYPYVAPPELSLKPADKRLLRFLANAKPSPHSSPFRHQMLKFEVKAPVVIARQWFKYRVGSHHGTDEAELLGAPAEALGLLADWLDEDSTGEKGFDDPLYARNEASRRYVTIEPEFYIPTPDRWRSAPENRKQGSGAPLAPEVGLKLTSELSRQCGFGLGLYEGALLQGVCAEQARFFLNYANLMTVWRWTCSLTAFAHFLRQRLHDEAQWELQEYARAAYRLGKPRFPESVAALLGEG